MRKGLLFLSVLLSLYCSNAFGQCAILSDSTVCLDEPIGFVVQSTSTVSSISWDFGDGNSSSQINPFHRYIAIGSKTVKATVSFAGGGGCVVTKDIYVHDPPKISVSVSSTSNFCVKDNLVCLTDATKPGSTGVKVTRRDILWGDGNKTETLNPTNGNICHKYLVAGKYTITIEATNEKGCSEFKELDVEVFPDYKPSFYLESTTRQCDGNTLCFESDSSSINPLVAYFRWDFDDGSIDTVNFLKTCHKYTQDGLVDVRLITRTVDGCLNQTTESFFISLPDVQIDVLEDSFDAQCYPFEFNYSQTPDSRYKYNWSYFDSSGKYGDFLSEFHEISFFPPDVGVFYINLTVRDDQCVKVYRDTVRSIGVKSTPLALNRFQCIPDDTVFFCQRSTIYRSDSQSYFWNFGDSISPQCTTNLYQPAPVYNNCNYWWGEKAQHLYNNDSCTFAKLIAYDHTNGCVDSTSVRMVFGFTEKEDYRFTAKKLCEGIGPDDGVVFLKPECGDRKTYINFDSLCGKDQFYDWSSLRLYSSTCHPDGWVTVGISIINGSDTVYRSCDSSDYYIDSSNFCIDTFWYHNWFKLEPTPKASFTFKVETCVPAAGDVKLDYPTQDFVRYIFWDWGDGIIDTTIMPDNYDSLPGGSHVYKDAIEFEMHITLATDNGCSASSLFKDNVGYQNSMNFDTSVCINFEQVIFDSLFYWDDQLGRPWRDTSASKPELLVWDLDDGRGFATTGPKPTISYSQRGIYTIRMASVDRDGCRDTAVQKIYVGGSKSGIKEIKGIVVCDDAVQFFDSSITISADDSIIQHKWLFGDGRAPSFVKDPFHFYSIFGEYEITHVIRSANGCVDTSRATLIVDGPVPSFDIVSDTVGCAPFTVEFDNTSRNVSNYIWYFGDQNNSTLSTSSDSNVTFTYTTPGTYYIYLYGSDSVVNPDNNEIRFCQSFFPDTTIVPYPIRRVVVVPVPSADFDLPTEACVGEVVTFVDRSDPTYRNFEWYISNGDTVITSQQNGKYKFTKPGMYSVLYRPTYVPRGPYMRECFDTITKFIFIRELPESDFILDSLDCDGNAVFVNRSTGATSYNWSFGDVTIPNSSDADPKVKFNDSGSFAIQLITKNQYGCEDTSGMTVKFDPKNKVSADLKLSPLTGCAPLRVRFSGIPSYKSNIWSFGEGTVHKDTTMNSFTYDSAGKYSFRYIAIDTASCNIADTLDRQVVVEVRPVAGFFSETDYCTGKVSIRNLSLNAQTYKWDFGNGQTSKKKDPQINYEKDGLYTVTLTVNDSLSCRSTFINKILVKTSPDTALFIPNIFTPGYDDFNPCYRIDVDAQCYGFKLRIYNRWGTLIYESDDPSECWDGTDSKTYAEYPSGTYFYILDLTERSGNTNKRMTGSITLLRD